MAGGSGRGHMTAEGVEQTSGFNVGELQQTGSKLPTDVVELRKQLEAVEKERDDLRQNQQRVNARWDGRVKRLETELATLRAGGTAPSPQVCVVGACVIMQVVGDLCVDVSEPWSMIQ